MILDFNSYIINEKFSVRKLKREVHGVLDMSARKQMRRVLKDKIVTFKFRKRNGDLRIAHGTLHPDYLPKLKGGSPKPEMQMVYFDLDKKEWRSFRSYSFIKILKVKPIESKLKPEPDEEEEIKKPVEVSKEEKEEKKVEEPEHTEEKEEKVVHHKEEKEKPSKKKKEKEDEEPESILDDKDTPEEKEVIEKDNEEEEKKDKEDKK